MTNTLYLVRHCQTSGQERDAPLTAQGYEQAEHLAGFLDSKSVRRIVSSPFRRAQESIAPFSALRGIPVTLDERLCERVLSGTNRDDWREKLATSFADKDACLDGGESSNAAMERGVVAVMEAWRGDGATVVVTHGNLLTLILHHFNPAIGFNDWSRLTNPDIFALTRDAERVQTVRLTAH